ncbi:MAG TPA: CHAT domain-containing protein [Candidatus Rubrimentiphilum sp.]|nr:CHAT domain-containing protein [Candidatus Rubrimentiphilum sp.]
MPGAFKNLGLSTLALSALLFVSATNAPPAERTTASALQNYADGFHAFETGEFVRATIAWEDSFSDARNHKGAPSLLAWLNYATAAADFQLGDYSIASDEVKSAILLHERLHYTRSLVGDYIVQARAASALGNYEEALDALRLAEAAARDARRPLQNHCDTFSSPHAVLALVELTRASVETSLGDDAAAKRDLAKASRSAGGGDPVAGFAAELASAYFTQASREDPSGERRGSALREAQAQATVAVGLYRKPQSATARFAGIIDACTQPGRTHIVPDRFTAELLEDPLWGHTTALAAALFTRGQAELDLGDDKEAAKDLSESNDLLEHPGLAAADLGWEVASLKALADARATAGDPAARPHMLQVLENVSYGINEAPSPNARWKGAYNIARAYAALSDAPHAVAEYENAIATIETLRGRLTLNHREAFLEDKVRVYDDYIEYLLQLYKTGNAARYDWRAFDVLQSRIARSTLDLMRKAQLDRLVVGASPNMLADIRIQRQLDRDADRYAALQIAGAAKSDEAANLWPQIVALQRQSEAIAARLASGTGSDRRYYQIFHSPPVDIATLRNNVLHRGETMLVYAWLPHTIAVWTIAKDAYKVTVIPRAGTGGEPDVERMIRHAFVDSIADRDQASFKAWSTLLYRKLFSDVVIPPSTRSLIIVPSGPLYNVAWEALVTGKPEPHCSAGYLICTWPISYSGSPQLLQVARALPAAASAHPFLAFAQPAFGKGVKRNAAVENALKSVDLQNLEPLPNSLREATLSAQAFHVPSGATVKTGNNASWQTLISLDRSGALQRYGAILFSTHGALPSNGVEPAIVLAHPEIDGWITASKISTLHLNARAVLLSACWTGAYSASGERPSGDGISALTRAFLYAGAHSVGVTLWPVTDAAAPMMVPYFFANLHGGESAAKALQEAKKHMIASPAMSQPYYWAPSVLYGDAN